MSPARITAISVLASMFPPERTTATGPLPPTFPSSSAAIPTAPAPSTTSFVRSSSSTIASAISLLPTSTTSSSSSSRIGPVSSPGFLTAIPSATENASGAARTPITRVFPPRASPIPDASPPPPIGTSTVSASGTCSSSSSPIVPWPATTASSS